jgi:hypothetical protein
MNVADTNAHTAAKNPKNHPRKRVFHLPRRSAYRYSRPFCAAVSPQLKPQSKAAQNPDPRPEEIKRSKLHSIFCNSFTPPFFAPQLPAV